MLPALATVSKHMVASILSPQTTFDWLCVVYLMVGVVVALALIIKACGSANVFELPDQLFFPALAVCVALWPIVLIVWLCVDSMKQSPTKDPS